MIERASVRILMALNASVRRFARWLREPPVPVGPILKLGRVEETLLAPRRATFFGYGVGQCPHHVGDRLEAVGSTWKVTGLSVEPLAEGDCAPWRAAIDAVETPA